MPDLLSPDAIKQAVQAMLAADLTIPDGHRGAVVVFVNQDRAEVVLAAKLSDQWFVDLVASNAWTGDHQIGIVSKLTW